MTSFSALEVQRIIDTAHQEYIPCEVNGCTVVALNWASSAVIRALAHGTLHEWAAAQTVREEMLGRALMYSVDLPVTPPIQVVVRRNRHGGLLGGVTGEYFLAPTRAPHELATSLRLAVAGIPTPQVIAYAIYPVAGMFARSDVMTRRLPCGEDAPAAWKRADKDEREAMLMAMANLLKLLAAAGAWHADLNLKNIYIAGNGSEQIAYLLDVDRVTFPAVNDIASRNLNRLTRSARKWRTKWGLDFGDDALSKLTSLVQEIRC
ncbi:MAG: lipopolysaccharide kinase InaA family protein [Desulfuromonadaceae bacterium]|nr:lipopolysaccharide kinase InaA family protein [Desulfuromonadaceae bacterium]MDD5104906.1 lipopolysaccharide kinase InaA family protein [Desulfuromonadaceae bacterium]